MPNWKSLVFVGVLFGIGGLVALLYPFGASLIVEQFAGWVFAFLGALQLVHWIKSKQWTGRIWSGLLGLVALLLGLSLIFDPINGLITLTMLVAILFLLSGISKAFAGVSISNSGLKWILLISGLLSLGLGVFILIYLQQAAMSILGLLLAIELLSNGGATLALGFACKNAGNGTGR